MRSDVLSYSTASPMSVILIATQSELVFWTTFIDDGDLDWKEIYLSLSIHLVYIFLIGKLIKRINCDLLSVFPIRLRLISFTVELLIC